MENNEYHIDIQTPDTGHILYSIFFSSFALLNVRQMNERWNENKVIDSLRKGKKNNKTKKKSM